MGLTSADIAHDDCSPAETECLKQPDGGSPEVSAELFDAVVDFQRWLAVPASARSVEEAILWHAGEAATTRNRFEQLPAAQRQVLLRWLESL
jgi:CxxC motif-containing protein (DUF1111 family)